MNTKSEITDLTICRAVFAAWVFLYHVDLYLNFSAWLGPFSNLVRRGYLGVDGFFMLSGLILARVHPELATSTTGTLRFWGKRLARIYPVHLVTLLIFAAIFLAGLSAGLPPRDPDRFALSPLIQNLFLVHGWGFAGQGAWNYPSWSVSTEWAGYLLFPILFIAVAYYERVVAIQLIVVAFTVIGLIAARHHHSLNLTFAEGLLRFFPEFILGICSARIVSAYADFLPNRGIAVAGAILALLSIWLGSDTFAVVGIWAIIFALTLRSDAEWPPMFGRRPVLRWFGLLSYAFYMSFAIAELLVTQWFRHQNWTPASHAPLFAAGMLSITLIVAILLHITVEVPCRRAADRWLAQPAVPTAGGGVG